jgi:hypothetical protein
LPKTKTRTVHNENPGHVVSTSGPWRGFHK